MAHGEGSERAAMPSPDEAFAVLGDETRLGILRELGAADGPLSFTALRDRVGVPQGAQFNYHLEKVVGHFVRKTAEGYALRQPGRRVVEAVLSGAVTDDPVIERTRIDGWSCPYCDAPTEVAFREERVERYCTECAGLYEESAARKVPEVPGGEGDLGYLDLPPAGVQDRSPEEVLEAAVTWTYAELLVAANGVCPRCSARVEHAVEVCGDHDAAGAPCDRCGRRQRVSVRGECTNCVYRQLSVLSVYLAAAPELLDFVTARGRDPLTDPWNWGWEYEEAVLSTDPFAGRFTFTVDGDAIALTVDDDLAVVDVSRPDDRP